MSSRTAVLLVNLGTPDAPTPQAVKRFLAEFLSDPRVIKLHPVLWYPILYLFVLPARISRVSTLYEHIWTREGSPMRVITKAQRDGLQQKLGSDYEVFYAMRYGNPSIVSVMKDIAHTAYRELIVLPLYPQHSDTTTTSVKDACQRAQRGVVLPPIKYIPAYYAHPDYIEAVVQSIQHHWDVVGRGEKLLFSFHGIPEQYVAQGDIYPRHCEETVRLVVHALQLKEGEYKLAYQSRFGPTAWLKPYADELLGTWAQEGIKVVDIISPAFAADCLETLEEIAIGYSASFEAAGGKALRYIPALNADAKHIDCMRQLIIPSST